MSGLGTPHPPSNPAAPATVWTAGRIVITAATALMALPFLFGLLMVFSSSLGSGDPHGYALLGGTFLVLVTGIVLVCLVPWLFRAQVRLRTFGLALLVYLAVAVLVGITLANA